MNVLDEIFSDMEPGLPISRHALHKPYKEMPALEIDASLLAAQSAIPADRVVLVPASQLNPQPISWLWKDWLAHKKLHILAGAPGQGKTTLAINMAATISNGGTWPDGSRAAAGRVLIWSGEDDPADTLVPRLCAAGANLEHCSFITTTRRKGEVETFDPAKHLSILKDEIHKLGGVSLLVMDPVVSAVNGDSHKNTEVRRSLQPLVDLAAECGCAILGITHFSKAGQGTDPTQRVVGSVAFTAVARVVMVAAKVQSEDGQERRVLARSKSNIGPDDGGFEYSLEQTERSDGIQAASISWGPNLKGTARELLTDHSEPNPEAKDIASFLRSLLAEGPQPAQYIFDEATAAGYSSSRINRASVKLGVVKQKAGMKGAWVWRLPS